jgi:two-component sensor histidine kinase
LLTGPDIATTGNTAMSFARLLHEFASNSAQYGSLSLPGGSLEISCEEIEDQFSLVWSERNGPLIDREPQNVGFGTRLANATVVGQLGGAISRDWKREGLEIRLRFSVSLFRAL